MSFAKLSILGFVVVALLTTVLMMGVAQIVAAPNGPTDESKVPHYFGPNPNWALSPLTLPDVAVNIVGDGSGAAATAAVGGNGAITGITITDPGSGYTSATVSFTGAGADAAATATVAASGSVTGVTVTAGGSGYTKPTVAFDGGGGTGTLVQVGNPLIPRAYATDFATPPGTLGPALVIVPTTMPASGHITSIEYFNQATAGSSPNPSAGNLFHAYVLHPTGNPDEYSVLWDSGELTVPATADPVGVVETITVPDIAVTTGDTIAFYGEGIPLDVGGGADTLSYPAATPPVQGTNITVAAGDPTYPVYSQDRTYSFAANVVDTSGVVPLTTATATAFGNIDAIALVTAGSGYTFPTVGIDYPDAPDGVQATAHVVCEDPANATGPPIACPTDGSAMTLAGVVVDNPGSGYSAAPNVAIHDGTISDPIRDGGSGATATASLKITSITVDTPGDGYVSAPTVTINDPTGVNAAATAQVNGGAITAIDLTAGGSGYVSGGGIQKFTDDLPGVCDPSVTLGAAGSCPDWTADPTARAIPLAVPQPVKYDGIASDQYEIALVQYRTSFSSSLKDPTTGDPVGTLVRGYVQIDNGNQPGSQHIELFNELRNGTRVSTGLYGVTPPQYLGPFIAATKNKPVRIVFRNLLPNGVEGDLFLPTDSTLMGSGMGPMEMPPDVPDLGTVTDGVRNPVCSDEDPVVGGKPAECFKDNRATLHLHGGISPWISDGTPHQWITPASEDTQWPEGVSVGYVPDMKDAAGEVLGKDATDGVSTFYYTNQQSARLMFYHDHAWGITRLNVYAGEAAGYTIADKTEGKLITDGIIPGPADTIPLVVQDKTFVPQDEQLYNVDGAGNVQGVDAGYDPVANGIASYGQDPTWDQSRWGGYGDPWYHHVYMPAQNPGDPSGMSAYGRWMYGPWFWPPATPVHGPIANPYYDPNCKLDDQTTWQYQTDPFCEPEQIPGTPNISVGMEQFNDTPIVNGVAYPKITLKPQSYRLRFLNAANDRFFNLQWYVADPTTGTLSEVALNPAELAAAQTDPNIFPTPAGSVVDPATGLPVNTAGPDWIQIGSEGGFLPKPVVVDGQQPTTWIIDPTRFDVGNVDKHSLLLAPAERADVIVDFSKFAGKTLIMYNDAPAAFPARVSTYDYYTGAPDLSPNGAPTILPGYGPNTRTVMQVTIDGTVTPAPAFNLNKLQTAFSHKADGSGVFESGQHPIIVGQADYNSAYGTDFAASSNCNVDSPMPLQVCDGLVRVNDTQNFKFNTLNKPRTDPLQLPLQPKAIHDEMNATTFDEFGRMQANLGIEAQPPTPGLQNVTLYPFVNPQTEIIDGTDLPKNVVTYDSTTGEPVSDLKITPIKAADGSQIWRITHNGVDTHPIHFHLYDVQVLNRVTWDNIIIPTEASELGWKDTIRMSPLEDTIVALRPIVPDVPFELPNSIRPLNPMMRLGDTTMFNNVDPQGNPTAPIVNQLVNFGWEYVYHCHILSHEEMDMMRPVTLALPPNKPDTLAATIVPGRRNTGTLTLTWMDRSINETSFVVQQTTDGTTWNDVGTVLSPLDLTNDRDVSRSFVQTINTSTPYRYRVIAKNTVGYLDGTDPTVPGFQEMTVQSVSASLGINQPAAPTNLTATLQSGPQVSLTWRDNATNESGFVIERRTIGGTWAQVGTAPARNNTGNVTFVDTGVTLGTTYEYQVGAVNVAGTTYSTPPVTVDVSTPAAPTGVSATAVRQGNNERVTLTWTDAANNESGYTVQWSTSSAFSPVAGTATLGAGATTYTTGNISRVTWYFRVRAFNPLGTSTWAPGDLGLQVLPAP